MPDNDLSGRLGLDSTDFKTQIQTLNRELRVMESTFRAGSSSLGDWASQASGLEMRIKSLSSQMEVQAEKVARLRGEYERIAKEQGESSRGAQELLIKLNKETETLGKMETELKNAKGALDGMGDEAKQAGKSLDTLGEKEDHLAKKSLNLKDVMHGLGSGIKTSAKVIAGVAAGAIAAGAAIGGMVMNASNAAGEMVDLSLQTGISVEKLQEMKYVGDQLGVSQETMTGSMSTLVKAMGAAKDGSKDVIAGFDQLGVKVTDANGNLRDSEDVFQDTITALGKIPNETERDVLAMQLLGKSAQDLNPLIKASTDELDALKQEAHDVGAVMKTEDVEALESFGDEVEGLKAGAKGMMGTLASAFLPGFKGITGAAKGYMQELSKILSGSDGDLGKMAEGIGGLLGTIINDIAAKAPELMNAGLGILQGLINAIVSNLPVMIPAIISIISTIVKFIVQNLPILIKAGIQLILALVTGLLKELPMLIDAGLKMIITLATGIAEAIPQLIPAIVAIIPQIIQTLIENLPLLLDAAIQIILALVEGLISSLPILITAVPQLIESLITTIIQLLPKIGNAAVKIVLALVDGIGKNLPKLGTAAGRIITALVNGVKNLGSTIGEVGRSIVTGVWEGIKARATWFTDQVKSFFKGIVDSVKKVLGIKSPSTVFSGIGENLALGLGKGWSGAFGAIERDINSAIGALNPTISPSFAGATDFGGLGTRGGAASISVQVNAAVGNNIDIRRLARQVAEEIQRSR